MNRYLIYKLKDCKEVFDYEKAANHQYKSILDCVVKKFPLSATDEEINKYIDDKLGGNRKRIIS